MEEQPVSSASCLLYVASKPTSVVHRTQRINGRAALAASWALIAIGAVTLPSATGWAKPHIGARLHYVAKPAGQFSEAQQKRWLKVKPPKVRPAERKMFRLRGRISTSLRQVESPIAIQGPNGRVAYVVEAGHSGLKDRNDIDKGLANTERDSFKRELHRALLRSEHSPLRRPLPKVFGGRVGKLMGSLLSDAAMAPTLPSFALGIPYLKGMLGVRHDTFKTFEFAGHVPETKWERQKERIVDFVHEVRQKHVAQLAKVGITDKVLREGERQTGVKQRGPAAHLATSFCVGVGPDLDRAALAERWARRHYDGQGNVRRGYEKNHGVVFYQDIVAEVERDVIDRSAQLRVSLGHKYEAKHLPKGLMMAVADEQGRSLGYTLSQEAIEVLRSTRPEQRVDGSYGRKQHHEALQAAFENRFGQRISLGTIGSLHNYYTLTDVFEPGIFPDKPVETPWHLARDQAVVLDFGGQGARNGVHTRIAVARAEKLEKGKRADKALELARKGEILATEEMSRVKSHLEKSIREVIREDLVARARNGRTAKLLESTALENSFGKAVSKWAGLKAKLQTRGGRLSFSGDDGVFLPRKPLTSQQVDRLMEKLAAYESQDPYTRFSPRSWRLIVSKAKYPNGQRITTWNGILQRTMAAGETLHKAAHKEMEKDKRLGFSDSDRIMLGFDLTPRQEGVADLGARIFSSDKKLMDKSAWDATREAVEAGAAEESQKSREQSPDDKGSPELSLDSSALRQLARAA